VVIIHASSDRLASDDDAAFAAGFDAVADEVFQRTGKKVGFFIDALPRGTNAPGGFKPSPETTGSKLWRAQSMLGIECFIPEVWLGSSDTEVVTNWKRDFSRRWFATGIPFLMDISPGYDGHLLFGGSFHLGLTIEWVHKLTEMTREYGQNGIVFNAWNGYTESLAAVPSYEYGNLFYVWLQSLSGGHMVDLTASYYYLGQ
jgi:hypothetical protein